VGVDLCRDGAVSADFVRAPEFPTAVESPWPVGKLYIPLYARRFACRHCHDLTYLSVQAHDKRADRLYRNPSALIRELETDNGLLGCRMATSKAWLRLRRRVLACLP
jgi:hypothetical protein